ncbi:MAG: hypothetical protein M1825_005963 [Sarcosagium campestre]|nr:MAG: hypothetical protein M1825_005963 [Sarcosagium campestre]
MDPQGNTIGYMAEQERGMANVMARQWFRTHRSFTTHVFDKNRVEVLRFVRPFSYISSRIRVFDPLAPDDGVRSSSKSLATTESGSLQTQNDPFAGQMSSLPVEDMRIIGEAHQQWAPLRRKYNLFLRDNSTGADARINIAQGTISDGRESAKNQLQMIRSEDSGGYRQFAYVDEPFLSWDFSLRAADSTLLGSVNRNFAGFAREIFTDTGVYALRMDAASPSEASQDMIPQTGNARANAQKYAQSGMTLDKRAVMLATAVSLDFDYFSRHSGAAGPGFMPLWFPGMGSSAGEAEGAAEAGSEAGFEPGNAGNAGSQAGGDAGFEPEAEESGEDGDFWSGESMSGGSGGEKDWWNIFDDE